MLAQNAAISSRSIGDLDPRMQILASAFLHECEKVGLDILIYCTFRNDVAQNELYSVGRANGDHRKRLTNARAGESAHNCTLADGTPAAMAFDAAPTYHGKIDWNPEHNPDWAQMVAIGKSVGLISGTDWHSFPEYPHFQHPDFKAVT